LTTSSLDKLNKLYPEGRLRRVDFVQILLLIRANWRFEGFVGEFDSVGKTVQIGDSVKLAITDPCPRCIMPTLAQGDLPRDLGVMNKGIMQNRIQVPFAGKALPSMASMRA